MDLEYKITIRAMNDLEGEEAVILVNEKSQLKLIIIAVILSVLTITSSLVIFIVFMRRLNKAPPR